MLGEYLMLCGLAWAQFGAEEAGLELIRAMSSSDQEVRVLARTLLEQASGGSRELIAEALAQEEISATMASICGFEQDGKSKSAAWNAGIWFPTGSA